jgi:hypothetical protein
MPFCDGGMSESFHFTGWTENLHRQLDVMKRAGTMNKLFLVTTHYTRGEDKHLAGLFGLAPGEWTGDPGPPLATFHEMHMTYLARFLLGTPTQLLVFWLLIHPGNHALSVYSLLCPLG